MPRRLGRTGTRPSASPQGSGALGGFAVPWLTGRILATASGHLGGLHSRCWRPGSRSLLVASATVRVSSQHRTPDRLERGYATASWKLIPRSASSSPAPTASSAERCFPPSRASRTSNASHERAGPPSARSRTLCNGEADHRGPRPRPSRPRSGIVDYTSPHRRWPPRIRGMRRVVHLVGIIKEKPESASYEQAHEQTCQALAQAAQSARASSASSTSRSSDPRAPNSLKMRASPRRGAPSALLLDGPRPHAPILRVPMVLRRPRPGHRLACVGPGPGPNAAPGRRAGAPSSSPSTARDVDPRRPRRPRTAAPGHDHRLSGRRRPRHASRASRARAPRGPTLGQRAPRSDPCPLSLARCGSGQPLSPRSAATRRSRPANARHPATRRPRRSELVQLGVRDRTHAADLRRWPTPLGHHARRAQERRAQERRARERRAQRTSRPKTTEPIGPNQKPRQERDPGSFSPRSGECNASPCRLATTPRRGRSRSAASAYLYGRVDGCRRTRRCLALVEYLTIHLRPGLVARLARL